MDAARPRWSLTLRIEPYLIVQYFWREGKSTLIGIACLDAMSPTNVAEDAWLGILGHWTKRIDYWAGFGFPGDI